MEKDDLKNTEIEFKLQIHSGNLSMIMQTLDIFCEIKNELGIS